MVGARILILLGIFHCLCTTNAEAGQNRTTRQGKLLSFFQIVTFPNDDCLGTGNKTGTCYTANECSQKGGINAGSCASGYGVCCTVTLGCGSRASLNNTYFDAPGITAGSCRAKICPVSTNICQLRLDFNDFVIAGPSTNTAAEASIINGQEAVGLVTKGQPSSYATQCLTDRFTITGSSGTNPPVICGSNRGEHVYVDAANTCVDLTFELGTTSTVTRAWSIKVTQYTCDFQNLAPAGCTQYFFDTSGSGTVKSFNFAGNYHLANQRQIICVRRERGSCRICWAATAITAGNADFSISGKTTKNSGLLGTAGKCCNYGTNGKNTLGYDCVSIPGAKKKAGAAPTLVGNLFCGRNAGLVTVAGTAAATVCSTTYPFRVAFYSDGYESAGAATVIEAAKADKGFRLAYSQDTVGCPTPVGR